MPHPIPSVTDFQKLWSTWSELSEEEQKQAEGLEVDFGKLSVGERDEEPSLAQKLHNLERYHLFRDILNLYASDCDENDRDRFRKLDRELHGTKMRTFDLDLRIKRAMEGKEAANKKYKDGNWFGALYTYTVAWGCMVPYYPAAVTNAKLKAEYEKLEYQLWSNSAAMVCSSFGSKKEVQGAAQRRQLYEIGIRACILVRGMREVVTAPVVEKTCRRALEINQELVKLDKKSYLSDLDIEWFVKQLAALKGATGDYKSLAEDKKVALPAQGKKVA